ncbi:MULTISPECIES: exosortase A [unclassified Duganella]|uniref:exosortase A n=1 Tax=unclassified Duganella TaxID=2636909 RepID=UPI000E34FEC5|nr:MULTISPECIES: exosortase A [unclassified Duganella]RFP19496.1 exosortase A [Duganella sp. BJB475]RFP36077.1 exosortase A [Duganella sp. BJB476]
MTAALSPVPAPRFEPSASPAQPWPYACLLLALAGLLAAYWPTAGAMINQWWHSQTFAHGLLVPPVCIWLIWRQRAELAGLPLRPAPVVLLPLVLLGLLWFLAAIANVPVVQQYSLVVMVAALVALVLGWRYAYAVSFPLAYLLLAVPFGEVFISPLIEFTSSFTVGALQLAGIPVFRDNSYLSLPSGNWSVEEACSGLRYLIASVALGMLYAYLTYQSRLRRAAFIVVALLLPIVANGLRAFLIVLIGHYSNMTLAVGIDHLIYGWLFFGLVASLMFWVGARWRDAGPPAPRPAAAGAPGHAPAPRPSACLATALAGLLCVALWPQLARIALRPPAADRHAATPLTLAPPPAPWQASAMQAGDWHAQHAGQPQRWSANYSDGVQQVSLQLTWYRHQSKGEELLTQVWNPPAAGPAWKDMAETSRQIHLGQRSLRVRQTIVQSGETKVLVWRWYRQARRDTGSPLLLKLLLARSKLLGDGDDGAEIAVAARYDEQPEQAAQAMQALLSAMQPAIEQGLAHVAGR